VSDTTAADGSIDAVAASLIDGPPQEDEQREELAQSDEDDAQSQYETQDEAEPEAVEAADEVDEDEGADDSEADVDEDEPTEQRFTVKVDGREQTVDLPELLRGYSGQAYIQKGMKEVASAKTEVETVYTSLQSERQQLAQLMQAAQTGMIPMQPPTPPDRSLLQTDPIGYVEAKVNYDESLAAFQQGQRALQELNARTSQAQEQAQRAYLADQHRQLSQVIPAFAKPETAAKVKADLMNVGQEVYGYSPDELRGIADHRALRVLHDAAQYRRLMSGRAAVEKQAAQTQRTPTIKPGVKSSPQAGKRATAEKAKTQMKRTGSVDDVARFLLM